MRGWSMWGSSPTSRVCRTSRMSSSISSGSMSPTGCHAPARGAVRRFGRPVRRANGRSNPDDPDGRPGEDRYEPMLTNFQRHRDAEIRRDLDAVIDTFVDDRYLETVALGARSERRKATRVAYESYFTAFSDLDSDYQLCEQTRFPGDAVRPAVRRR